MSGEGIIPTQCHVESEDDEVVYIMRNNVRYVKPYFHEYVTYAKGRWIHKNIIDVLSSEFGAYPRSYWLHAVSEGSILVNGNSVSEHYQFKNADKLLHRTHRHEPPVVGEVEFLGENDKVLAVNKPASLPMHMCGNYRYNTLKAIVSREHLVPDQPELFLVHRLDRVTSGVVVMAKSSESANELCEDIKVGKTRKKYLARVKGIFPSMELSRLRQQSLEYICENFKKMEVFESSKDLNVEKSKVLELDAVETSRTHYEIEREIKDTRARIADVGRRIRNAETKENREEALIHMKEAQCYVKRLFEELKIVKTRRKSESGDGQNVQRISEKTNIDDIVACDHVGYALDSHGALFLNCPVGVVNFRDGLHACAVDGKQSLSIFKFLGYNAATNTSLVECYPVTGRTHQLRVHLKLLGNPIANDPWYGGDMYFDDHVNKDEAMKYLEFMRLDNISSFLKSPHFNDVLETRKNEGSRENIELLKSEIPDSTVFVADLQKDISVNSCNICSRAKYVELQDKAEQILHCNGIWLHALKYEGKDWSFETDYPFWATGFEFQGEH